MLQGLAAFAQGQANKAESQVQAEQEKRQAGIETAGAYYWRASAYQIPDIRAYWPAVRPDFERTASDLNYMLYGDREGPMIEGTPPARRTWRERFRAFLGRASAAWLVLTGKLDPYDCD